MNYRSSLFLTSLLSGFVHETESRYASDVFVKSDEWERSKFAPIMFGTAALTQVSFEPMSGPFDTPDSLLYEIIAQQTNGDPLRALLNGEAIIENNHDKTLRLTKVEVDFPNNEQEKVTWTEETLLTPDGEDRTMLAGGGWAISGYQVEPPEAGTWEKWNGRWSPPVPAPNLMDLPAAIEGSPPCLPAC